MTDHEKFVADMGKAGYPVRHFNGKNFWTGPAVMMAIPAEVQAKTSVVCGKHKIGDIWFTYPKAYPGETHSPKPRVRSISKLEEKAKKL